MKAKASGAIFFLGLILAAVSAFAQAPIPNREPDFSFSVGEWREGKFDLKTHPHITRQILENEARLPRNPQDFVLDICGFTSRTRRDKNPAISRNRAVAIASLITDIRGRNNAPDIRIQPEPNLTDDDPNTRSVRVDVYLLNQATAQNQPAPVSPFSQSTVMMNNTQIEQIIIDIDQKIETGQQLAQNILVSVQDIKQGVDVVDRKVDSIHTKLDEILARQKDHSKMLESIEDWLVMAWTKLHDLPENVWSAFHWLLLAIAGSLLILLLSSLWGHYRTSQVRKTGEDTANRAVQIQSVVEETGQTMEETAHRVVQIQAVVEETRQTVEDSAHRAVQIQAVVEETASKVNGLEEAFTVEEEVEFTAKDPTGKKDQVWVIKAKRTGEKYHNPIRPESHLGVKKKLEKSLRSDMGAYNKLIAHGIQNAGQPDQVPSQDYLDREIAQRLIDAMNSGIIRLK